jgi:hypothetical protein
MKIEGIAGADNSLTFLSPSGEGFRLQIGDVVQADVLRLLDDGNVSIRISMESGRSMVVAARSDVPLLAGESILLKVAGGGREIALRFLGVIREEGLDPGNGPPGLPEAYGDLAAELFASRLPAADARQALESFRLLPDAVKGAVPGFGAAFGAPPGVETLNGAVLQGEVEDSGILLETKLKLAIVGSPPGKEGESLPDPAAKIPAPGSDGKETLLRLREVLRDRGVAEAVSASGESPGEAAMKADGLVSTIESFQLASAAHGGLYAPLILGWDELKDGEMLFRKRSRGKGESYTCELNLDLRPLGKMSVSVTMYEGAFFVSFSPESEETRFLMASRSDEVGKRFREAGLALKAINVHRKKSVRFGSPPGDGVDLEV